MSGHSKWATIKRKKGANDAKRGAMFTKFIKEITVAARMGGGDPNGNPRLRTAIDKARASSMPMDNIERAIKKGTGDLEGVSYEEMVYEGYGPAGVAIIVESLTDNKNRTVSELRNMLSKNGGNLGESGSVSWMFDKKGIISFEKAGVEEDKIMEVALEAGAEDIKDSDVQWDVVTAPSDFDSVKQALEKAGFKSVSSDISLAPKNTIALNEVEAQKMLKLMDLLEEHDDVQKVSANFDISTEIMEKISG